MDTDAGTEMTGTGTEARPANDDDDIEVLDNIEMPRGDGAEVTEDDNDNEMEMDQGDEVSGPNKKTKSGQSNSSDEDDGIKIIDEASKSGSTDDQQKSTGTGEEEMEDDDDEDEQPRIRLNTGIFDADDDEEEEDQLNIEADPDIVELEVNTGNSTPLTSTDNDFTRRSTPRRAAAQAAANNIKVMTNLLLDKNQGLNQEISTVTARSGPVTQRVQCHQCKKFQPSQIVVQQFGTDIHLCSNSCFNAFRNPDPARRPLACSKCGILSRDTDTARTFYWETMNFCSDICVCNFQMEIGSKCSSCSKRVAWNSLGKYCVRFGSDIRQFCTSGCLDSYKKNARVCFHCQLDIKRLDNVVLANIPGKPQPKEFCSQNCVEMYIEQNLQQQILCRPEVVANCVACGQYRKSLKTLVLKEDKYETCSEHCWKRLLESRSVQTAAKCEICTKFVSMESLTPNFYLASDARTFGFCSATCKNVYVLKNRQILMCTTCKVKKYNYDLIEFVNAHTTEYVVCSLHCLPRPSQFVLNLKSSLLSAFGTASSLVPARSISQNVGTGGFNNAAHAPLQIQSVSSLAGQAGTSTASTTMTNGHSAYTVSDANSQITLRQASDDDIIEIRDVDAVEEEVSLEDERWAECETLVIVREPEPVPMRNKRCMAKPLRITKETQTDTEELQEAPRVEVQVTQQREQEREPLIRYVPVIIPVPVYIPVPYYALETPVPIPFPFPVPVPIPLPIDKNLLQRLQTAAVDSSQDIEDDAMETEDIP